MGRKKAKKPLGVQRAIRMTPADLAEVDQEISRLSEETGTEWDFSKFARMAIRQYLSSRASR